MGKINWKNTLKRLCSVSVALALILGLVANTPLGFNVDAATVLGTRDSDGYSADYESFSGVEKLTASGQINILEIIPNNASRGSIGFYIPGQEIILSQANIDAIGLGADSAEREAQFNSIIDAYSSVVQSGGTNDNVKPIYYSSYTEIYPWNYPTAGISGLSKSAIQIPLTGELREHLTNSTEIRFIPQQNGDFIQHDNMGIVDTPGTTIEYSRQQVERLTHAAFGISLDLNNYYYVPTFQTIEEEVRAVAEDTSEDKIKEAIIKYGSNSDNIGLDIYKANADGILVYDGTLGVDGYGFSAELSLADLSNYFIVADYGKPSLTFPTDTEGKKVYFSTHEDYISVENTDGEKNVTDAYFKQSELIYEYVGEGNGDLVDNKENLASDSVAITIQYDEIYIDGFTNNNWFFKYALDGRANETMPDITVDVRNSNDAELTSEFINGFDLVIVSDGFNVDDAEVTDLEDVLSTTTASKTPVLFNEEMDEAWESLEDDADVAPENVIIYDGDDDDDTSGIVQSGFKDVIEDDEIIDESFRDEILKTIEEENLMRSLTNVIGIPEEITMGAAIRHLIDYKLKVEIPQKEEIRVLEIQPIVTVNSSLEKSEGDLTPKIVSEDFLGGEIDEENITIDMMSISEFVSKIDDITEIYDLVYIGTNNNGYNEIVNDYPDYNDDAMDGMYYTNIGDVTTYDRILAGLLESDYASSKDEVTIYDGTVQSVYPLRTYSSSVYETRFPGLDLTPRKTQDIINFAMSGFPVVLSDKLVITDDVVRDEAVKQVSIEATKDQNMGVVYLALTNPSEEDAYPHVLSYQWYKDGEAIEGETFRDLTVNETGVYYCEVILTAYDTQVAQEPVNSNEMQIEVSESSLVVKSSTNRPGNVSVPVTSEKGEPRYDGGYFYPITNIFENGSLNKVIAQANFDTTSMSNVDFIFNTQSKVNIITDDTFDFLKNTIVGNNWFTYESATVTNGFSSQINFNVDGTPMSFYSLREGANTGTSGSFRASGYMLNGNSGFTELSGVNKSQPTGKVTSVYQLKYTVDQQVSADSEELTLKITPNVVDFPDEVTPLFDFTWYEYSQNSAGTILKGSEILLEQDSFINISNNLKAGVNYACVISDGNDAIYETVYFTTMLDSSATIVDLANANSITIPKTTSNYIINEKTVDNSSNMYEALTSIAKQTNVMNYSMLESDANKEDNRAILVQYLNLSKPEIVFSTKADSIPKEYTGSFEEEHVNGQEVKYTFTINNDTDPTPQQTKYTINFYVDLNADGRHDDDEDLTGLHIVNGDQAVQNGELLSGVEYTVSKTLPETYKGAIPWKLEVVETDNANAHNSQTGITYIKPQEAIVIKVMQIVGSSISGTTAGYGSTGGPQPALSENDVYSKLFNELREEKIYDIQTNAYSITELNDLYEKEGEAAVVELFDQHNMLMFGFQESYGRADTNNGFSREVAILINEQIERGKPTLFSHDNLSVENVPYANQTGHGTGQSAEYYSGYYLNVFLRGNSGQDKYGVSSLDYGFAKKSYISETYVAGLLNPYSYITANQYEYSGLGNNTINENLQRMIEDSGYAIAYQPGSDKTEFLEETQGFSLFNVANKVSSTDPTNTNYPKSGFLTTSAVSQVNKGQITSYPYDVNVGEIFGGEGSSETLKIATTHHQWYELNLSQDDVVVWYTLALDGKSSNNIGFENHYNDGANGYFIYNVGNVTYTGSGHGVTTKVTNVGEAEAQLFVNTMIAAYRASETLPVFTFSNSVGGDPVTEVLVSSVSVPNNLDDFTTTTFNMLSEEEKRIKFYIENDSLTDRSVTPILLIDQNGNGEFEEYGVNADGEISYDQYQKLINEGKVDHLTASVASTGGATGVTNPENNTLYYFNMTEDMMDYVVNNQLTIGVCLVTSIDGEDKITRPVMLKINMLALVNYN